LIAPLSVAAAANDDVYTVGNYPVDAQAANAVAAKDKALADGQQAAFRSLLKRVVPVTDYDRLKRLKVLKAASFFEGGECVVGSCSLSEMGAGAPLLSRGLSRRLSWRVAYTRHSRCCAVLFRAVSLSRFRAVSLTR